MPCPSPWCAWSNYSALACLGVAYLTWMPYVFGDRLLPRPERRLILALVMVAVILVLGVGTWTCLPCGEG